MKNEKEKFYNLTEVNHYLGEEESISINNDYDDILKKFLKNLIKNFGGEFGGYFKGYFSEKLENDLDGVNSWEDFFKFAENHPQIIKESEGLDNFYVCVYDKNKRIKTISEYKLLKEIYNKDRKSLNKAIWNK
jgi:hypothetical protein